MSGSMRLIVSILAGLALSLGATAKADNVSNAAHSVVRVIVVVTDEWGSPIALGHGSGFAISPRRVVTNAHILPALYDTSRISVGIVPGTSGKLTDAPIVKIDRAKDLALLQTNAVLPPLSIYGGSIPDGADVIALGYPGNVDKATIDSLEEYVAPSEPVRSQGNYSNRRNIDDIDALLHTAAIARGNSGGPLLDECGRVLGVNSFTTLSGNGDAPFAFAISGEELGAFLRSAGQKFVLDTARCVTAAERIAAEQEIVAQARRRADEARHSQAIRELREQQRAALLARRSDQNWIGFAVILGLIGLIGMGASALLQSRDRSRSAAGLVVAGALCLLAGLGVFFGRPIPNLPRADPERSIYDLDSATQEALAETNTSRGEAPSNVTETAIQNPEDGDADGVRPKDSTKALTKNEPVDMTDQYDSSVEPINYAEGL